MSLTLRFLTFKHANSISSFHINEPFGHEVDALNKPEVCCGKVAFCTPQDTLRYIYTRTYIYIYINKLLQWSLLVYLTSVLWGILVPNGKKNMIMKRQMIRMCEKSVGILRQGKVKLSLCLTNQPLRHEGVWGSGCIDPCFLDLGTSWRWVVSFTSQILYPRGKSPRYSLKRRLGGPQNRSGRRGEGNIFDPTETRTPTFLCSSP
jgi:hypothetical protein